MRDEFVDTCGLCDAPLRMGQRCACGDNWRAAQPAPAQPARGFISVDVLSKMFEPMDGIDKHAEGYHWRRGWNDALRRAMDYATAAQPVAWFSPEQKRAMAIIQSAAKALEEGTFTAPPALHEAVDILRKLLTHGWAEDCQECAIGQSSAWADAKALIARVDAARRDGGE